MQCFAHSLTHYSDFHQVLYEQPDLQYFGERGGMGGVQGGHMEWQGEVACPETHTHVTSDFSFNGQL